MGVFWTGLKYVFTDFSCWTSTHGLPHIGMANARWLRIFWILVVVASTAGFISQFATLLANYLNYDVNTETTLQFAQRTFPTVTICHINPWKVDETKEADEQMSKLIESYNSNEESAEFGFSESLTANRQLLATMWTLLYSERLYNLINEQGVDIGYTYDDMVVSCTYDAKTCNESDFIDYYNSKYGMCVQFNSDGDYESSRAGPLYGLRMVMRTDQATYLPWTETAGVMIDIHMEDEVPYPDVSGYYAPPGTASSLGVSYVSTTRLGSPYGTCTSQTTIESEQYSGMYTVEACLRACIQESIIAQCGCYYPAYSHAENDTSVKSCDSESLADMKCSMEINDEDFSVFDSCDCSQPCQMDSYGVTVSTAKWPSSAYTPTECSAANDEGGPWTTSGDSCIEWYNDNTLLIEIYFERMNFQVLNESPSYSFVNFISDVGGQVGLFLGMSIISVIEFFVLLFLLIIYCSTHKTRKEQIEQLENDIQKAKIEVDRVAERRKKLENKNAEMYELDDINDVVPPKPVDNS